MAMLTVEISDELMTDLDTVAADQSTEAGGYVSRSAVVRQALREFRDRQLPAERRARPVVTPQAQAA